jgi:hypothetical protein
VSIIVLCYGWFQLISIFFISAGGPHNLPTVSFVLHSHITENGMIGDEVVAAYFKVLYLRMPGGLEENH